MQRERNYRRQKKRWPLPRGRCRDLPKLLKQLMIAGMLMIALSDASCVSTRKSAQETISTAQITATGDTTTAVIKEIRWESVPRSEVTLRLSVDSLHKLPAEASYSKRSGRAQVEVRARGDTVYITGSCDSLQRWVEYYAALYHSARDALEEQEAHYEQESKERGMPIKAAIAIFAAGIVAGTTITIIIKNR